VVNFSLIRDFNSVRKWRVVVNNFVTLMTKFNQSSPGASCSNLAWGCIVYKSKTFKGLSPQVQPLYKWWKVGSNARWSRITNTVMHQRMLQTVSIKVSKPWKGICMSLGFSKSGIWCIVWDSFFSHLILSLYQLLLIMSCIYFGKILVSHLDSCLSILPKNFSLFLQFDIIDGSWILSSIIMSS